MSLFICNILPLFPLDVGRFILALIKDNKRFTRIYKIYKLNSIVVSIIFIILFFISVFQKINISLLLIAIFLILSIFDLKNGLYYQYAYMDKDDADYNKILPIKNYFVPLDIENYKLLKLINKNSYSVFYFVNKSGNIVKSITEREMLSILKKDNKKT